MRSAISKMHKKRKISPSCPKPKFLVIKIKNSEINRSDIFQSFQTISLEMFKYRQS